MDRGVNNGVDLDVGYYYCVQEGQGYYQIDHSEMALDLNTSDDYICTPSILPSVPLTFPVTETTDWNTRFLKAIDPERSDTQKHTMLA